MQQFIDQAREDYDGVPVRITQHYDRCDEEHVIIEMLSSNGEPYWLDWIGGAYAPEPDEMDEVPFINLSWTKIN